MKALQARRQAVPANLQAAAAECDKFNQKDEELKKQLAEAKRRGGEGEAAHDALGGRSSTTSKACRARW